MKPLILESALDFANEIGTITDVSAFDNDIYVKGNLPTFIGGENFKIHLHIEEKEVKEDGNTL